MSDRPVLWQPNSDVQRRFLACSARIAMMGGGAGGGKTSALLAAAATQCANPLHRAVIFRRDYPSLKHIISASYALFLPLGASYNRAEHTWTFRSGATLEFAHLEDETAMYQHAGKEYSFLGFDELQQLPGNSIDSRGQPINSAFAYMQSRLRAPADSGLQLEVRCTATPGAGSGAFWVKAYFRIPDSGEDTEFVDEVSQFRRAYFKTTVADNPALAGTNYERQLLDLPAAQRKALLHGDWSAHVGQVFEEYSFASHTCGAFPIPRSWAMWRSCDDGFASEAAVLWLCRDPVYDRVYIVREIYQRGLTATELGRLVLETDHAIPIKIGGGPGSPAQMVIKNDEPLRGMIDSASFASVGSGSRGDEMNAMGCAWTPCEKGAGSRIAGVNRIHEFLAAKGDGLPGLVIFREHCRNLIRELPAMVYGNGANAQDIDPGCPRHLTDALAYALSYKPLRAGRVRIM